MIVPINPWAEALFFMLEASEICTADDLLITFRIGEKNEDKPPT